MRVLIDTYVFLWWVEGNRALPPKARSILADLKKRMSFQSGQRLGMAITAVL